MKRVGMRELVLFLAGLFAVSGMQAAGAAGIDGHTALSLERLDDAQVESLRDRSALKRPDAVAEASIVDFTVSKSRGGPSENLFSNSDEMWTNLIFVHPGGPLRDFTAGLNIISKQIGAVAPYQDDLSKGTYLLAIQWHHAVTVCQQWIFLNLHLDAGPPSFRASAPLTACP